jgi:hypothetical protein
MTDTTATEGQAATDSAGTTVNAPNGTNGTSGSAAQTTGTGPVADAIDSFFDPASIAGKPELEAAYKQMQGSYTKRMQDIAKHRPKIEAYERFEKDPVGTLKQLAQSYGYQFVQAGENQPKDWAPQSWDDVMAKAKEEVLKEMRPVFNEVKSLKKQNVESYLDTHFSDWRTYESEMMETLQAHPSLVNSPDKLYRLSVPDQVWEARATKAAMQRLKGATDNAQVSGGTTVKQTSTVPTGPLSFNQAVEVAKSRLAAQGLKRPAN